MIREELVKAKTYKEWYSDATIDKSWMLAPEFFLGMPLKTSDAPIDAVMRASVYSYILDTFGGRRLGLRDTARWSELFRSSLIEVNGAFWKQFQMDALLRINDMVTADYSEFSQDYNRGTSASKSENTGTGETKYVAHDFNKSKTDPVSPTTTPLSAAKTVSMQSNLAEATYVEPVAGLDNGMPAMDTSHGDTANGQWSVSETNKAEQSAVTTTNEDVNSGSNTNASASSAFVNAVNDSISGSQRVGHRDYNGYNLTASIEAVQALLPYTFLNAALSPLFNGMQEVLGEDGENLWL